MGQLAAVLVGDLVGSTTAGTAATDRAFRVLADAARDIADWSGHPTHFTRFRGDGWQLYLDAPFLCLDAALYLVARLRAADLRLTTRIAVGFGTIERLGSDNLSDAAGEAFVLAGQALDAMPRHARIALANWRAVNAWHEAVFGLALWTASRWSPHQAEAVAEAMRDDATPTQTEIAQRLGITRQAAQARLSGAGWDALKTAMNAVRRHDWAETHA